MPHTVDMRALGAFAATHYSTFTNVEAAANGINANVLTRLVRDNVIERVRPGIYRFTGIDVTWKHDLYAATLGLHTVASHFSAGPLHRFDEFEIAPVKPEILCHHKTPVHNDMALVRRTTWLPKADTMVIDGIPCTTMARTIVDLAPFVDGETRVRMVDHAQRSGASLTWLIERAKKMVKHGRSGPTDVLDILRRRVGGYQVPESWFERMLAECLCSPVLEGIVRQYELRTTSGSFVARFDFAIPWVRLGVEAHSRSYHLGEVVEQYDEDRDMRATKQGWEISYLGFAATRRPAEVRRDIEEIVIRRAIDLGLTPPSGRHVM